MQVRYVVNVKEKYLKTKCRLVDTINGISTEESVKHNSIIILNTLLEWPHVSASKRPSSGHPLINNSISIKSITYEMLARYVIPCGRMGV